MTINETHAADAINYLVAARATTIVDHQADVWADYLNHEVDDPQPDELLPACRHAIRTWRDEGRAWQIDVETYAQSIRRLRRERVDAHVNAHGRPDPDGVTDPRLEQAWRRAWRRAVERGAPPGRAVEAAWAAIGQAPPARMLESGRGRTTARSVIEALTSRSNRRAL